jgi:Tol biopolymer transport system component
VGTRARPEAEALRPARPERGASLERRCLLRPSSTSRSSPTDPALRPTFRATLSSNGNVIAFQSDATNLVKNDLNGLQDVFVHELDTLKTTRVSVASDGSDGNYASHQPALSADGRYVAFLSLASNLVPFDDNGKLDVFVHDRLTHSTRRVSVSAERSSGAGDTCLPSALLNCATPALSADGSIVVFESDAGDPVPGSVPGQRDIYWARWQELPAP